MKLILLILVIIVLSIFTVSPILKNGFFEFHDNTQVVRVYEMGKMLSYKIFPVRWVPDLGYGYGYPIFNFYGPLPYYIGGVLNIVGFDSLTSTKLMFGIGILLSALTMFFFSRKFFGNAGGILSAIIYAYFPYHAVNIYVRGAVGEFFAYAFLPLLFLGIFQLLNFKKFDRTVLIPVILISFGLFLITTSHNLTFFMLMLLMIPALFIGIFFAKSKKIFITIFIGALGLGILLSAFYIFPAFYEMKFTDVSSQIGGGANFKDHFVCLGQYLNSAWGFGGSIPGCIDGISFKLGSINILLFILACGFLIYSFYNKQIKNSEKAFILSFILLLISLLFTLPVSSLLWEKIPYIEYIQYPWRFINFIALFGSFVCGYIGFSIQKKINRKIFYSIVALIVLAIILQNHKLFMPQKFDTYNSKYYTQKEYINFTVSKISDEYMPRGFITPKNSSEIARDTAQLLRRKGILKIVRNDPLYIKMVYNTQSDNIILVSRAYFPSWRADVNGKSTPIVPTKKGMQVKIPKGEGVVAIKFENTPIQLFGNIISVSSFLSLLAGIIIISIRKSNYAK